MSTASSSAAAQHEGSSARLRNFALDALFAFGSLGPRLIHLRRSPSSWLAFRVLLGFAGAALVVVPLGLWNSWVVAIVGMAMFLAAVLLPPAKPIAPWEEKARELGAFSVPNGGEYQPKDARAARVQLFVGREQVSALDSRFQSLLVIPAAEISSVRTVQIDGGWNLQILWPDHLAEFRYRGIFAERRARVAEEQIASVIRSPIEPLPRSRAARA